MTWRFLLLTVFIYKISSYFVSDSCIAVMVRADTALGVPFGSGKPRIF